MNKVGQRFILNTKDIIGDTTWLLHGKYDYSLINYEYLATNLLSFENYSDAELIFDEPNKEDKKIVMKTTSGIKKSNEFEIHFVLPGQVDLGVETMKDINNKTIKIVPLRLIMFLLVPLVTRGKNMDGYIKGAKGELIDLQTSEVLEVFVTNIDGEYELELTYFTRFPY